MQDAGEGSDSCIHLGVKIEEGRKVDVEHRNLRKEPDGEDRARGLGGDSDGLSLAIRTSASGAAKNDAAVPLNREGGESVGRKDCVGGKEKPAFVQRVISRRKRRCG